jgi:thymidylate synthase
MNNYLSLLENIMRHGCERQGRNAVTKALFAQQLRWDLREGFPIVTTKKVNFRAIVGELLWFISGSTDDNDFKAIMGYPPEKKTIWSANAEDPKWRARANGTRSYPWGSLGRIYGAQWRRWRGANLRDNITYTDQLSDVIERIRLDPYSRYLLVSAWNPADIEEMALPACHVMYQFFCTPDNGLSLSMIQRSCDTFLGVPYNISSYALLLSMVAQVTGRIAKELVIIFQDVHIYQEHYAQVEEQLKREPKSLPTLEMNPECKHISDFTMKDFQLLDYEPHEAIKAEMIV